MHNAYQPAGEAMNFLNEVRIRAGLQSKTATEIPNQAAFRLALEQERRVELAFEGHRWFDLVRTDRAIPVLNAKKDQLRLVRVINTNDMVFPIPQSQIDINRNKITQNQGY
ncbi:MAG: RagB/SusD family nutrient uptake outer membrane protein [Chitinophagaceae bacterium]|nr:MAG: RagB/SusD family nutrient uptake outer membrane protein [Chitinophagaceae bacterium]